MLKSEPFGRCKRQTQRDADLQQFYRDLRIFFSMREDGQGIRIDKYFHFLHTLFTADRNVSMILWNRQKW